MPTVQYPFDTTGLSPANRIVDEPHTLTEINSSTYRIIIPEFAPFYLDNFQLKHVSLTGVVTPLIADVDYYLCLPYIGATRSIGKFVYGGATLVNRYVNGHISVTYQTLGGTWTADCLFVLERLADMMYNPKITSWDVVTNVQEIFPPINHDQQFDYVYGQQELIEAINQLAVAILQGPDAGNSIIQHIFATNNPHIVTAAQVGLGSVVNYPVATDQECTNKELLDKYVTLRQVIQFLSSSAESAALYSQLVATQQQNALLSARLTALEEQVDQLINNP